MIIVIDIDGKIERLTSFFLLAEDGIRTFCLSRGLGDVYKKHNTHTRTHTHARTHTHTHITLNT